MKLTPKERERFTVFAAAGVTQHRKGRGVPLDHPEAVTYVTNWCIERGRDEQSVAEIHSEASQLLDREDVMDGVPEMIDMIRVEPMFPDGTKLVTVHDPVRSDSVSTTGSTADAATDGGDTDGVDASRDDDT